MAAFRRIGILGPKETPDIGSLPDQIVSATRDGAPVIDWATIMEVTDAVNSLRTAEQLSEVVRLVRKRLSSGDKHARVAALHLIEALAKNCGMRFLQAMGHDEKFLSQMGKCVSEGSRNVERVARPPEVDKEIFNKSRDLVQAWGEEFLPIQKEAHLEGFVQLYHDLRAKGFRFRAPQLDDKRPPIFTPPMRDDGKPPESRSSGGGGRSSGGGRQLSSAAVAAMPPKVPVLEGELGVVQNMATMTFEMLSNATDFSVAKSDDVLTDLLRTLDAQRGSVQRATEAALLSGSPTSETLLALNDAINAMLASWKTFQSTGANPLAAVEESKPEPEPESAEKPDEGDDEDLLGLGSTSPKKSPTKKSPSKSPIETPPKPPSPTKQQAPSLFSSSSSTTSTPPLAPPASGRRRTRSKPAKEIKPLAPPPSGGRPRVRSRGGSGVQSTDIAPQEETVDIFAPAQPAVPPVQASPILPPPPSGPTRVDSDPFGDAPSASDDPFTLDSPHPSDDPFSANPPQPADPFADPFAAKPQQNTDPFADPFDPRATQTKETNPFDDSSPKPKPDTNPFDEFG